MLNRVSLWIERGCSSVVERSRAKGPGFETQHLKMFKRMSLSQRNMFFMKCFLLQFLQKDLSLKVENDPDVLLQTAFQVKYNARRLRK